jgi:hypothetical protein
MKNLLFFINHVENSISKTLIYYFAIITFTISAFLLGMTANTIGNRGEIIVENKSNKTYFGGETDVYENISSQSKDNTLEKYPNSNKSVIFGSVKGKYFYYKGCGGDSVAAKNLRYYKSEAEAIRLGKILYKQCE